MIIEEIQLPDYFKDSIPDYERLGRLIDNKIFEFFNGQEVALRCLSLDDHLNMSIDELVQVVSETGTDRYDPDRESFWHKFSVYEGKGIELFASRVKVDKNFAFGAEVLELFHEGAKADRGYSVKLDLITVYDPSQLEPIYIEHEDGGTEEAWKFSNPDRKKDVVLGILKLISK